MMGLLGNVAEVKWLRPKLMTQKFIEVFAELLSSESDGIEVRNIGIIYKNVNLYLKIYIIIIIYLLIFIF